MLQSRIEIADYSDMAKKFCILLQSGVSFECVPVQLFKTFLERCGFLFDDTVEL